MDLQLTNLTDLTESGEEAEEDGDVEWLASPSPPSRPATYPSQRQHGRTNRAQFQLMLTFMEEHGDLSRLSSSSPHSFALWSRLQRALNASDPDTKPRTLNKWKKVWSDLKNNTKRKALRLARSSEDCQLRLSRLEFRLLKLIGVIKTSKVEPRKAPSLPTPGPVHPPAAGGASPTAEVIELRFESAFQRKLRPIPLTELQAPPQQGEDEEFTWTETLEAPAPPSPRAEPQPPHSPRGAPEPCTVFADCGPTNSAPRDPAPKDSTAPRDSAGAGSGGARPDTRGHTSARGRGRGRGGALAVLARALARGEARRGGQARRERALRRRELRLQERWLQLCGQGLALLERFLDKEKESAASVPEDMERWTTVLVPRARPRVLNPDRDTWPA